MAGEAYNVELNLRSIDLHMEITSIKTALQLMTSFQFRKYKRSPNVSLTKFVAKIEAFTDKPISSLELKKTYTNAPWASLPFAAIVKDCLETFIEHEKLIMNEPTLTFYPNGSGINEHISAAAVNINIKTVGCRYLSKAPDYTVYSAELMSIILTLETAHRRARWLSKSSD